ncbi:M3 family oligoendopeptidase [Natrinema salaciae]|uniref:Peptidase family M3 n=1 Tax=Natrinema salaciae TaxID=1186196 RepID=A0A1H9LDQ2_9EURY|nr:M3 family metallopeptidase [Natrinema salaciae]SER09520.1 Peptidase family M3 [Natrinema salaciae]
MDDSTDRSVTWSPEDIYESSDAFWTSLERVSARLDDRSALIEEPSDAIALLRTYEAIMPVVERLVAYARVTYYTNLRSRDARNRVRESRRLFAEARALRVALRDTLATYSESELADLLAHSDLRRRETFLCYLTSLQPNSTIEGFARTLHRLEPVISAPESLHEDVLSDVSSAVGLNGTNEDGQLRNSDFAAALTGRDRNDREQAYRAVQQELATREDSIAGILSTAVLRDERIAKDRGFDSALEATLRPHGLTADQYRRYVTTVRENATATTHLRRRRRRLGVDQLHIWDLYVPLDTESVDVPYSQACDYIVTSAELVSSAYKSAVQQVFDEGWIEVYPGRQKRDKAHTHSPYGVHPYVMANYRGNLRSMFTLAHEVGHAVHARFTNENQRYVHTQPPTFVSEIPSTFQELLLARYIISNGGTRLRSQTIEYVLQLVWNKFFRRTLWSDFERRVHEAIENRSRLGAARINRLFEECLGSHWPVVTCTEAATREWQRIPDFYTPYTAWKYAFGITIAISIETRLDGNHTGPEDYLTFLKAGSSERPSTLLERLGVRFDDAAVGAVFDRVEQLLQRIDTGSV